MYILGRVDYQQMMETKLLSLKFTSVLNVNFIRLFFKIYSKLFIDPGIDKLKTREETIIYFNDCLQSAGRKIPNERKSRAHILLAATAGMRLLE